MVFINDITGYDEIFYKHKVNLIIQLDQLIMRYMLSQINFVGEAKWSAIKKNGNIIA